MLDTLERAKNNLRQGWETPKGAICPCCGQTVKIYPRQVYKGMAKQLIRLYRLHRAGKSNLIVSRNNYHHMKDIGTPKSGGGDFSKLKYWGLIYSLPETIDPDKKSSGYWMISKTGIDFVLNKCTIKKYCHVYNNKIIRWSGNRINILDALAKDKFNYPELMGYLI